VFNKIPQITKCKNLGLRVAKAVCLLNVFAQPDHKFLHFVIW